VDIANNGKVLKSCRPNLSDIPWSSRIVAQQATPVGLDLQAQYRQKTGSLSGLAGQRAPRQSKDKEFFLAPVLLLRTTARPAAVAAMPSTVPAFSAITMKAILPPGIHCSTISEVNETGLLVDVAENKSWIDTLFPDGLPLDPEEPVFGEDGYEQIAAGRDTLFPKGIHSLSNLLSRGLE